MINVWFLCFCSFELGFVVLGVTYNNLHELLTSNHSADINKPNQTRYVTERKNLPLCKKEAEYEKHFLISCSVYQEKRKSLFECLSKKFKIPIAKMSTENIFLLLLNPPNNNVELQKIISKHMHDCYKIRKKCN